MNREYRPLNNSYREHFKLHGCFNEQITEQILDKLDELELELSECISSLKGASDEAEYWREKYEKSI
jgi:hypothetical protein